MNYRNIINKGASILRNNTISTANLDAEILLSKSLNKTREEIILNLEEKLNVHQINYYYKLINRRKKKEPISLITKKKYFWKSEFIVNKNVLTPRFETEFLVEEVLKIYKQSNNIITRLETILNNIESLVKSSDITLRNLRNTIRSIRVSMSAGYLFSQFFKRLGKFLK